MALDTSLSTRKDLPLELASASDLPMRSSVRSTPFRCTNSARLSTKFAFYRRLQENRQCCGTIRPGLGNSLYDAMYLGSQALDPRHGRKVMVVITDGAIRSAKWTTRKQCARPRKPRRSYIASSWFPLRPARTDTGGEHALITLSEETGGSISMRPRFLNWTRRSTKSVMNSNPIPASVLSFATVGRL